VRKNEEEVHLATDLQEFLELESTPLFINSQFHLDTAWRNSKFIVALCSKDAQKDEAVRSVFRSFATEDKRDKMFFICPNFCTSNLLPTIDSTHTSDLMVLIASSHHDLFRMDQNDVTPEKFSTTSINSFIDKFSNGEM
jgi:hypothetical protein